MKKTILLLLIIIPLMLSSCSSWSIDEVSTSVSDTEGITNGAEYVGSIDFKREYKLYSETNSQSELAPGAGMFLFSLSANGNIISYDPLHDRASYFCFDPACTHPLDGGCVAKTLKVSSPYTYYDGYFYFAYTPKTLGQNSEGGIARVSLDGTEMKVIYKMNCWYVTQLKAGGGYLYIKHQGINGLDRYDLNTGEYLRLDHDDEYYNGFAITENGVILHSSTNIYLADHDLKNKTPLIARSAAVYTEDKIYHLRPEYAEDGKTVTTVHFYEYDISTGVDRFLYTQKGGIGGLHCADEKYLYFSPNAGATTLFPTGGIINRIDVATGECVKVFDDSRLDVEQLYSIDGKLYAAMKNAGGFKSWLPGVLNNSTIFGKLIDEDGDGMYEFVPFEWDGSELGYDRM